MFSFEQRFLGRPDDQIRTRLTNNRPPGHRRQQRDTKREVARVRATEPRRGQQQENILVFLKKILIFFFKISLCN